jgi:hypothetical protein
MPDLCAVDGVMRSDSAHALVERARNLRGYMSNPDTPFEQMHEQYQVVLELVNAGWSDARIARHLGCTPSHCWEIRNSPAGQAVLREASEDAMPTMQLLRLQVARNAHRAALLIGEILENGEALGYSLKERLALAKWCIGAAGLGPQRGKNQQPLGINVPVSGDVTRMGLMMELTRQANTQSS